MTEFEKYLWILNDDFVRWVFGKNEVPIGINSEAIDILYDSYLEKQNELADDHYFHSKSYLCDESHCGHYHK